jgi:hypothetical protein
LGTEVGFPNDLFEVYQGKQQYPLDSIPVWRYSGKDALKPSDVTAVKEFRKVVEASERQMNEKKAGKKP